MLFASAFEAIGGPSKNVVFSDFRNDNSSFLARLHKRDCLVNAWLKTAVANAIRPLVVEAMGLENRARNERVPGPAEFPPEVSRPTSATAAVPNTPGIETDALSSPRHPLECTEADTDRWNAEWLRYLGREWRHQLKPHTEYPGQPSLPDTAEELLDFRVGGTCLRLYCDPKDIENKRIMEMGCGCGNLGKLVSRYADSYLGVDYSTLALMVARLVSPDNCTYLHVADKARLEPFCGTVDTIISRYFWIHQNMALAKHNLDYLQRFLNTGGHLYADFRWPNPQKKQFVVLNADQALSGDYPSATFRYDEADVAKLIEGSGFEMISQQVVMEHEARYVVLRKRG